MQTFHVPLVSLIFLKRSLLFPILLFSFALISEEGFLISSCYSLELCIQMDISFLFSFASLLFSAIYKASWDNHFEFLYFFFLVMVLITASCTTSWTSVHSSSGTLSIRSKPLNHEPCCVGPPKMDGSWWRILTKHGPLEKGMAKHFSILALRTPWTYEKAKR